MDERQEKSPYTNPEFMEQAAPLLSKIVKGQSDLDKTVGELGRLEERYAEPKPRFPPHKAGLKNAIEWGNQPRTLAFEPLDSEHILACPRLPLEQVLRLCPDVQRFHDKVINNAPNACCHQVANIEIEAWYSCETDRQKGIPDIYKLHCSCGRCHVSFCVGGSRNPLTGEITHPRPFWEIG